MKKSVFLFSIPILLVFTSCNRRREIIFAENPNLKIEISTDYAFEDNIESYYYELQSSSGTTIIPKTWFLSLNSYKEVDLKEFITGKKDSIIFVKFNRAVYPNPSIVFAYNLKADKLLNGDEITSIFGKARYK